MSDLRKAAEMALEALEMFCEHGAILRPLETKEALRQALAEPANSTTDVVEPKASSQPEQEPVAWMHNFIEGTVITHEPADIDRHPARWTPLYTAPPKREWVGLTDEERRGIREWQEIQKELGPVWAPMMLYLYVAIEAKLKEKNT